MRIQAFALVARRRLDGCVYQSPVCVIDLVPSSERWPLLVTGPLESWSSPQKSVSLMGDAARSMVKYIAQGTATSMECGAFLGHVPGEVMRGLISLEEAIRIYEKTRISRIWMKKPTTFAVYIFEDGPRLEARDRNSAASVGTTEQHAAVEDLSGGNKRTIE